jgi:hypothetical protein
MTMANDSDPESIADLLQALDDVRDAARRVDRERNFAGERPERPAGTGDSKPTEIADDDPL